MEYHYRDLGLGVLSTNVNLLLWLTKDNTNIFVFEILEPFWIFIGIVLENSVYRCIIILEILILLA